jgi:serine/threonine protein kinase
MQSSPKIGEKEIAFYVRQVVNAIMYIHSKGILHREYYVWDSVLSYAIFISIHMINLN